MIDLRSDTITKPTRDARSYGKRIVGDDVYDPTVNKLEETAELVGKEVRFCC